MSYNEYLRAGLDVGSFMYHLYHAIEIADLHNRNRLWYAFPTQVNEVDEYQGHKLRTYGAVVIIEEICAMHDIEPPDDLHDLYDDEEDVEWYGDMHPDGCICRLCSPHLHRDYES